MKLFVFEHCPFCIKAMMLVGLKKMPVELVFIQNHDVNARIEKVGYNAVPILEKEEGDFMAESLDIVHYLDAHDNQPVLAASDATIQRQQQQWEQGAYPYILPLLFPRTLMVELPEFASDEAKQWFEKNKSAMIGMDFASAYANSAAYLQPLNTALQAIDWLVLPSERDNVLSYDDINFYPTLRSLTLIKGIEYPARVRQYIDEVTALTGIQLFDDIAV